MKLSLV